MLRPLGRMLVLVSVVALGGRAAGAAPSFVRVEGTRFYVGSKPFYFVGANLNVMHGEQARRRAAETIAAAAADGLSVGRIWALGEGTAQAADWQRRHELFRSGPTGWQEAAFLQLDRVLVEARRRGLRLIITLSNHWSDYGGAPMYLRWLGQRDTEAYGYGDRFFSLPGARKLFLAHIRKVVGRVNSITKQPYANDPTIMAWELQNELLGTPEAAAARRAWIREMSAAVRQLAPRQLVVPGTLGYGLQLERAEWVRVCKLKEVSYCDQHSYPEEHLRTRRWVDERRYIDDRVQLAHYVVGKPIVFGEVGFADGARARRRAQRLSRFVQRVFYDGGNGVLAWIYQPTLEWRRRYGILIDQPAHRVVRGSLAKIARTVARRPPRAQNPLLGPARGVEPIERVHVAVTQRVGPARRWEAVGAGEPRPPRAVLRPAMNDRFAGCRQLLLPVDRFFRADFEDSGMWHKGVLVHAYGRRTGTIEYRFVGPRQRPMELFLRTRLSSEYPGAAAPPGGVSAVEVTLDGERVARWVVPPDDGVGRWFEARIPQRVVARWRGGGVHRLALRVAPGPRANGVALYGREGLGNREPVEDPGPPRLIACPGRIPERRQAMRARQSATSRATPRAPGEAAADRRANATSAPTSSPAR